MADVTITDKGMQARAGSCDKWLSDPGARGGGRLVGRITTAGERRFYFRYTDSRVQQVRLLIGPYDARGNGERSFTVQQARDRARAWSVLYRSGIRDLRDHFAQQRADTLQADARTRKATEDAERATALERERHITVRKLFERWCAVDLQPHRLANGRRAGRKDGGDYTQQQFGRHVFPLLGDRLAKEVRKADLLGILDAVKAAGKLRTCNVLLADLKQMFAFALFREIVDRNPLDTVSRRHAGGANVLRERTLSIEEIGELARRLPSAKLNSRYEAGLWLLLATGARVGELCGATWPESRIDAGALGSLADARGTKFGIVDTTAKTWHLPTTKNEREHTIHLSEFALDQLTKLAALRELGKDGRPVPWLFSNAAGTAPITPQTFGKQLADRQRTPDRQIEGRTKANEALTLPGGRWTAHDLRRTAGTLMAKLAVSGDVIDECLNHMIENHVRRTYIRDRRPTQQAEAFETLGASLREIIRTSGLCGDDSANEPLTNLSRSLSRAGSVRAAVEALARS